MTTKQTARDDWEVANQLNHEESPHQEHAPGALRMQRLFSNMKSAARKVLGERVVGEFRQYRTYAKSERPLYLKMRILNGLGVSNPKRVRPPDTSRSFLFVCFGNIMRSCMCEALLNRELPHSEMKVTSAGLNAIPGKQAHPWAVSAAQEFGVSLEHHRARLLTSEMIEQADAIFIMDYQNHVQILSRHPSAKNKVFLLSAYAGDDYRPIEIHDPYYLGQEGTVRCYQILQTCINNLSASFR